MNDTEWLSCTDPGQMLQFLRCRASERKLIMFAAACCRRVWHLMTDPRCREVIDAAERLADGLLSQAEFETALQSLVPLWVDLPNYREDRWLVSHYMTAAVYHLGTAGGASYAASYAARGLACLAGADGSAGWLVTVQTEETAQCSLLRDLFGNPSHPFRFDPVWLAEEGKPCVDLAGTIYHGCRFELLPSLADTLNDRARFSCTTKTTKFQELTAISVSDL